MERAGQGSLVGIMIMMQKVIRSEKQGQDFFGGMNHYDSRGHKVGETRPGFFGGMNHYDDRGRKTGHSDRNFLGDWNHYDD